MIWMARRATRPSASGLDRVSYEIDLGQPNRARLAGAFAPFIAAGRRVSRGRRRRAADSAGGPRADRRAVRAWAREDADGARRR